MFKERQLVRKAEHKPHPESLRLHVTLGAATLYKFGTCTHMQWHLALGYLTHDVLKQTPLIHRRRQHQSNNIRNLGISQVQTGTPVCSGVSPERTGHCTRSKSIHFAGAKFPTGVSNHFKSMLEGLVAMPRQSPQMPMK